MPLDNFLRAAGMIVPPEDPYLHNRPPPPQNFALSTFANQRTPQNPAFLSNGGRGSFQIDRQPVIQGGEKFPSRNGSPVLYTVPSDTRQQYVQYLKENKVSDDEIQEIIASLYNNETSKKPSYDKQYAIHRDPLGTSPGQDVKKQVISDRDSGR